MVRVVADGTIDQFPSGVSETQHDGRRGFAEVQSVAGSVERLARRFRQGLQRLEARHNEAGLHLCAHDHHVVETAAEKHPAPLQEGRQAGDAGVGHDHGRIRIPEGIREPPGGNRQRDVLRIDVFDVSLDGRKDKGRPGADRVDAGSLNGPPGRLDDHRIEERAAFRLPQGPVHQGSHERLLDAEHPLVAAQGRFAPAHRLETLLRRGAERRQDALSDDDDLPHSASFSPRAVFRAASAMISSPTRTVASTREMPKTSSRRMMVVVSVSPTAGSRCTRNFRMAPI